MHLALAHRVWPVFDLFVTGWQHPEKEYSCPARIFAIDLPQSLIARYENYRLLLGSQKTPPISTSERMLFHGTPRQCCVGDPSHTLQLCSIPTCNLCCIVKSSFQLLRAGTAAGRNFMRFGRGIYTTSVSSKADDYTIAQKNSHYKAMLVAKVLLGTPCTYFKTCKTLTAPPIGFHSIMGQVGQDLKYDEQVVYCDEAIHPAYLIVYEV